MKFFKTLLATAILFILATPALATVLKFSDIGVYPGAAGDPVLNAQRFRAWAGDDKSIVVDCSIEKYRFDTGGVPIELGFHRISIMTEGPNCAQLQHVAGAGGFLSFNGGATHPSDLTARRVYFGEIGREIMVRGAIGAGTTDLIYISRLFDSHFNIRTKDGDVHVRVNDYSSIGSERLGMVQGTLNVSSGPGQDNEQSVVGSRIIVTGTYMYSVEMRLHLEGNGWVGMSGQVANPQYAAIFNLSNRCVIRAHSSMETNVAGGLWLTSGTDSFEVHATDNEANNPNNAADIYDWVIKGTRHNFFNIAGKAHVNADRVNFFGATFLQLVVVPQLSPGVYGSNTYTSSKFYSGVPNATYDKLWNNN